MNPKQQLEQAVYAFTAAHTITGIEATSIYKGVENPTEADDADVVETPNRVHPSITIIADGSHEEVCLGTKVFRGPLIIQVEADGQNTTDTDFDTLCKAVFAVFDITTLADNFSTAKTAFHCFQANIIDHGNATKSGGNWTNAIVIDCAYAPHADLT